MTAPQPATTNPPSPSDPVGAETSSPPAQLRAVIWTSAGMRETEDLAELRAAFADEQSRAWVDIVDADEALIDELAGCLGIHPLVAEDILERNQRAKIERTDETLHIVMFALAYEGGVEEDEVDIVLGKRFLADRAQSDLRSAGPAYPAPRPGGLPRRRARLSAVGHRRRPGRPLLPGLRQAR